MQITTTEEVEKKWSQKEHDLDETSKEVEALKDDLNKMKAYANKQHALGMLTGHEDLKASVARGKPLSSMASPKVEFTDSDEDVEIPELSES